MQSQIEKRLKVKNWDKGEGEYMRTLENIDHKDVRVSSCRGR